MTSPSTKWENQHLTMPSCTRLQTIDVSHYSSDEESNSMTTRASPSLRRTSTNSSLSSMASSLSLQMEDIQSTMSSSFKKKHGRKSQNVNLPPRSPSKAVRWRDLSSSSLEYEDRWNTSSNFQMDLSPKRPKRSSEDTLSIISPPSTKQWRKSIWSAAAQNFLYRK